MPLFSKNSKSVFKLVRVCVTLSASLKSTLSTELLILCSLFFKAVFNIICDCVLVTRLRSGNVLALKRFIVAFFKLLLRPIVLLVIISLRFFINNSSMSAASIVEYKPSGLLISASSCINSSCDLTIASLFLLSSANCFFCNANSPTASTP